MMCELYFGEKNISSYLMFLTSDHFRDIMSARVRINPSHNWSLCSVWLPRWLSGKESTCQCRRHEFDPWVGKIPWRRKWQPTPVLLPGEFHGQVSLAGCSPRGHRVSDMS